MRRRKIVGIVCDFRRQDGMADHRVGDEYVVAIGDGAGALPLLIPVGKPLLKRQRIFWPVLMACCFPAQCRMSEPARYGGPGPGTMLDLERDATSLPLQRAAIAAGKPVLAICRGFQELNVALGGSLHQELHTLPGRLDHREKPDAPLEVHYGPRP